LTGTREAEEAKPDTVVAERFDPRSVRPQESWNLAPKLRPSTVDHPRRWSVKSLHESPEIRGASATVRARGGSAAALAARTITDQEASHE
jgi:hypothetical protein